MKLDADGVVRQVLTLPSFVTAAPEGFEPLPPGLAADDVRGKRRRGDAWEDAPPPPEPDLLPDAAVAAERLPWHRERALADLVAWLDAQAEGVSGRVPASEKLTWDAKEKAAKAVLAAGATAEDLQLLALEALVVGEPVPVLAQKVVTNAAVFRIAGPLLAAVRRRATAQIEAGASVEAVEAAGQQARALFAAIMADPLAFAADPAGWLAGWAP